MSHRAHIIIAATVCAVALVAAGCGSDTHHNASDPSAKQALLREASLGFGAFHRFIWVPARAGRLSRRGSPVVIKARVTARFASESLRAAARHARGIKRLRVLFAPLQVTADKISAVRSALSKPHAAAEVEAINQILHRIANAARKNGARIVEAPAAQIGAAGGPRA